MATTTSPSNDASLPAFDLDPIDGQAWCERVTREEIEAYAESIKNSDDANAATAFAKAATSLAAQHEGVADIAALAAECERLASAKTRAPLIVTSPAKLVGSPPARRWIVPDWIPCGVVTGIYGDGGLGKSLLAQQLQTSTSLGTGWLGLPVEKCASLGIYCEDSGNELWRRQADINSAYGVDFDALGDVHWLPRLGEDNLLIKFSRGGVGELTQFHSQVLEAACDFKAKVVVVDTASDAFAGNENDRGQVRQFISRALGSIAQRIDGAVLLCAHPSRSGLASGEGDGGSTGWSNAFRSRLYLRAPVLEDGETPDPNARVLERRKANYASRNDELRLRWRQGVIEPEAPESPGLTPFGKLDAWRVFLDLVRDFEAQGRPVSDNSRSGNYAPRIFGRLQRKQRYDFREADFRGAMETLFANGKIENAPYGRKSDERRKIVAKWAAQEQESDDGGIDNRQARFRSGNAEDDRPGF